MVMDAFIGGFKHLKKTKCTNQASISRVLASRGFYDQLLGDTWLFFQVKLPIIVGVDVRGVRPLLFISLKLIISGFHRPLQLDSAVCKRQRHLLREFVAKGMGGGGHHGGGSLVRKRYKKGYVFKISSNTNIIYTS
jgi:hypothetical protein